MGNLQWENVTLLYSFKAIELSSWIMLLLTGPVVPGQTCWFKYCTIKAKGGGEGYGGGPNFVKTWTAPSLEINQNILRYPLPCFPYQLFCYWYDHLLLLCDITHFPVFCTIIHWHRKYHFCFTWFRLVWLLFTSDNHSLHLLHFSKDFSSRMFLTVH